MKKTLLKQRVLESDNAKKVNPLDLSSDQDLTIGLMNMLAIEDICLDTNLGLMVHDMRVNLMKRIVKKSDAELWNVSQKLLALAIKLINQGTKAQQSGDINASYRYFDDAYHAYSLFWGVNMGMVAVSDIET